MAIVNATAVSNTKIPGGEIIRATAANVAVSSTSDEIKIALVVTDEDSVTQRDESVIIKAVSISCSSTDFDTSLRTKGGAAVNTVDEVYQRTASNLDFSDTGLWIPFGNQDGAAHKIPYIYLVITNDDAGNATGTITIEITVESDF